MRAHYCRIGLQWRSRHSGRHKDISALGTYAASAITAITVQNTCGVTGIHPVPPSYVKGQIEAVMTDIRPRAVKIGMINDVEIVQVIAESLKKFKAGVCRVRSGYGINQRMQTYGG